MNNTQKQLQLKHLNYYFDRIDGLFGYNSKEATKKFQKDYGLVVDGYFGRLTELKSIEVWKNIQTLLNNSINANLVIDGLVGNLTIAAIKKFQQVNNLKVDGYIGPITMNVLIKGKSTEIEWSKYPNFKKEEFKCGCNGRFCDGYPVPISETILILCQRIRNHFNKPLNITSGVRCQKFNDSLIGSIPNSLHRFGRAADCYIPGVNKNTLLAYVQKQPETRYSYTNNTNMGNAIHFDVN